MASVHATRFHILSLSLLLASLPTPNSMSHLEIDEVLCLDEPGSDPKLKTETPNTLTAEADPLSSLPYKTSVPSSRLYS